MKSEMNHMIILLPGIMGSVLQKDDKDVWALSGQALLQYLMTLGKSIESLQIKDDNSQADDLNDGIKATRLIEDLHSVPLLVEHAGYSVMVERIKEFFDVEEGSIFSPRENENFFTFPYDWRRDNRVTARKLQEFIERQLYAWRKWSGADDAQVLLIGHSMGGLISRYYLEVLEGWRDCRALITVGSPHRGAVKALDLLSNGMAFKKLSELVRSFRSAWQIMPTYAVVDINGTNVRASETSQIPNIDQKLASDTRTEFLIAIYQAAMQNWENPPNGYMQRTIPWIGTRQDTYQSARLINGKLSLSYEPPYGLDPTLAEGDGTVPRVSALPADLDLEGRPRYERFAVERHAWLTNNDMSLEPILETLKQIASPRASAVLGGTESRLPSVNLRLESLYLSNEPVTAQVKLTDAGDAPQALNISVDPVGHAGSAITKTVQANTAEKTMVEFYGLLPGLYQLSIEAPIQTHRVVAPTHGVFEVVDPHMLD